MHISCLNFSFPKKTQSLLALNVGMPKGLNQINWK